MIVLLVCLVVIFAHVLLHIACVNVLKSHYLVEVYCVSWSNVITSYSSFIIIIVTVGQLFVVIGSDVEFAIMTALR